MAVDPPDAWQDRVAGRVRAALRSREFVGIIVRTEGADLDELATILETNGARDVRQVAIIDAVAAEAPESAIRAAATHEAVTKIIYDGVATITQPKDA